MKRPSPALVISVLALFVALGGTSYAVTQLPKGSVGTAQLKKGAVTKAKISKGARKALRGRRGPAGSTGPAGVAGPAGPQGIQGPQGNPGATNVIVRRTNGTPLPQNVHYVFNMKCEPGERAIGGGAGFGSNLGDEEVQQSYPAADGTAPDTGETPDGWVAIIENKSAIMQTPFGVVICASP